MKLLVIDDDRPEVDFVWRAKQAEHEVKWYVKHTDRKAMVGKGMVERVPDFRPWLRWADLIVVTSNTIYLREIDAFRREMPKVPVIAATQESAAWEIDRVKGMEIFKAHGIEIPPYREFSNYDEAIAYVKKENRAFVSKPCGDEPDKSLSYVAKSPADLVYMLERWKKAQKHKSSFILQDKIDGTEMAVGGWFGPGGFNKGWLENFEFKKLMTGDLGVATGEMGTVMRYVEKSKLADKVLKPLANALEKTGHTGYVDVNCIIDEKGTPWPLEFTTRFGYPTFNIQRALHEGNIVTWLADLAQGHDARRLQLNEIALGAVLSIPDFPYSHLTAKEVTGIPIYLPSSWEMQDRICPLEVMSCTAPQDIAGKVVDAPCLATAGDYVLVAIGTGPTIHQAHRQSLRLLNKIKVPNSPMWRTDIGRRLKKQLPSIQKNGYATSLEY